MYPFSQQLAQSGGSQHFVAISDVACGVVASQPPHLPVVAPSDQQVRQQLSPDLIQAHKWLAFYLKKTKHLWHSSGWGWLDVITVVRWALVAFTQLIRQFVTTIRIKSLTCFGMSAKTRRAERAAAVGPPLHRTPNEKARWTAMMNACELCAIEPRGGGGGGTRRKEVTFSPLSPVISPPTVTPSPGWQAGWMRHGNDLNPPAVWQKCCRQYRMERAGGLLGLKWKYLLYQVIVLTAQWIY